MDATIYSTDILAIALEQKGETTMLMLTGAHGNFVRVFMTQEILNRLRAALDLETSKTANELHDREMHPDFEYATTKGPRKGFHEHPPVGDGWERNTARGRNGWERFNYHEEAYWRRLKVKIV